jgi:guanylate kinase
MKCNPIVLVGKSGSGKDSIAKILTNKGYKLVLSYTTRPIRENETDGVEYNFCSKDDFLNKIENNELLEYRKYYTLLNNEPDIWYYGTPKDISERSIIIVDKQGLIDIKKHIEVTSFYIHVENDIRKQRAEKRGSFDISEWNRRLIDDNIKFENIIDEVNYVIYNKDLKNSVNEILSLL